MSDTQDGVTRLDQALARVSAMLGLAGSLFIIATFVLQPRLRRPMNRLLFYTSLGNLFLDTFYFVSVWGIPKPGGSMHLCRTQGFMIQIFSLSPSLWTTSMAINVYLIVFRKFTTLELKRLEPWYISINYGIPLAIAFVFLMLDVAPSQKAIYGPATLWCWIDSKWQWMRMAFTFGPIWVLMLVCFVLFIITGMKIVLQALELRRGGYGFDDPVTVLQVGTPFVPPTHVIRFTEVQVTESFSKIEDSKLQMATTTTSPEAPEERGNESQVQDPNQPDSQPASQDLEKCPSKQEKDNQGGPHGTSGSTVSVSRPSNAAHWLPRIPSRARSRTGNLSLSDPRAVHALKAAQAYAKISILVFMTLLIVHTPAGANRIYMMLHDGNPQPTVTHFHAALNPLQGLLDAIIYVAMSWPQCRAIFRDTSESIHKKIERRRRRRENARNFYG
ncbi:GPCR family 2-like protein [Neofusicoccum parvum]|nr:GPCR family 2-like protein [Neofusicoccum parvum]